MLNRLRQLKAENGGGRFEIRADAGKDEATIYLYDIIGEDWYGGVSGLAFIKELNNITAGTIHLRINSPGGDVFEARAIQTALRAHSAKVVAHIDGLAASSATFLAMGADEIEMAEGAFFMIHNAWCFTSGNSDEMRKCAEYLDKVDGSIRADYVTKTGKNEAEIAEMMASETWMSADEAMKNGFVDRISEPKKTENHWNLSAYNHVPDVLRAESTEETAPEEPEEAEETEYDRAGMERRLALIEMG